MAHWKETAEHVKALAEAIQFEPGDDINKVVRFGLIDSEAGNDHTCFSTWFFAGGDLRHVAAYSYYVIWFAQHESSFSLAQLKEMTTAWIRQPGEFCGYCGFLELWDCVQEVIAALDTVETNAELVELLNSMWHYASNMNAWLYHYIPWGVGYMFPIRDKAYFEEGLRLAQMP